MSLRLCGRLKAHIGSSGKILRSVLFVCRIGQFFLRIPMRSGFSGLKVVMKMGLEFVTRGFTISKSDWANCDALNMCWFRISFG